MTLSEDDEFFGTDKTSRACEQIVLGGVIM